MKCDTKECTVLYGESLVQPMEGELIDCPFTLWNIACFKHEDGEWNDEGCYNTSTDLAQFQRDVRAYYVRNEYIWQDGFLFDFLQKKTADL